MTIYIEQQNQDGKFTVWTADDKKDFINTVSSATESEEHFTVLHGKAAFDDYLDGLDIPQSDICNGTYDSSKSIHVHQNPWSGDDEWNSYDNQVDCDKAEFQHWVDVADGDTRSFAIFHSEAEAREHCADGGGGGTLRSYLDIEDEA